MVGASLLTRGCFFFGAYFAAFPCGFCRAATTDIPNSTAIEMEGRMVDERCPGRDQTVQEMVLRADVHIRGIHHVHIQVKIRQVFPLKLSLVAYPG